MVLYYIIEESFHILNENLCPTLLHGASAYGIQQSIHEISDNQVKGS
jgi:hypothetical protein